MAAQVEYREHQKLLRNIAYRVQRRIHAAGAKSVQLADIEQELAIAWCHARDRWEPQHNVPFEAYLTMGAYRHINTWVETELRQIRIAPFDLDYSPASDEEDGSTGIHEIVADPAAVDAEKMVIEASMRAQAIQALEPKPHWSEYRRYISRLALQFFRFLDQPPPALEDILSGYQARARYARSRGITGATAPTRITSAMVFDLMGLNRWERQRVSELLRQRFSI